MKRCGDCGHSMNSTVADEVYCIASSPQIVPVHTRQNDGLLIFDGRYQTVFPVMRTNGKCGQFDEGKTQDNPNMLKPVAKPKRARSK